jgi:hypothetical protein
VVEYPVVVVLEWKLVEPKERTTSWTLSLQTSHAEMERFVSIREEIVVTVLYRVVRTSEMATIA